VGFARDHRRMRRSIESSLERIKTCPLGIRRQQVSDVAQMLIQSEIGHGRRAGDTPGRIVSHHTDKRIPVTALAGFQK
jgi:hypothetical protein